VHDWIYLEFTLAMNSRALDKSQTEERDADNDGSLHGQLLAVDVIKLFSSSLMTFRQNKLEWWNH
jgi:hypothetical protein